MWILNYYIFNFSKTYSQIGFVTSIAPGLVETSSKIKTNSGIVIASSIAVSRNNSSIFSLGSFGKIIGAVSSANVVVFGILIQ
jgi:hypothetical protein